eukprot:GEMP01035185.1.p1 GENE.GEMP01035185.1~~GEMP01035185.1.p1  ORF type:complete len:210 (+),score=32.05 GEMP01035185.1:528-1157(+)
MPDLNGNKSMCHPSSTGNWSSPSYPPIDHHRSSSSHQSDDHDGAAHAHALDLKPPLVACRSLGVTSVDARQQQSEVPLMRFAFYRRWRAFFEQLHQINIVEVADPGKAAISAHVSVETRDEETLVVQVRATAILYAIQFVRFEICWPIAHIVDYWQRAELFTRKFADIRIFRRNEEQVAASAEAFTSCRHNLHDFVETLLRAHDHLFHN